MLRIIKIVTSKTYVQKALILNGFFLLAQSPGERERTIVELFAELVLHEQTWKHCNLHRKFYHAMDHYTSKYGSAVIYTVNFRSNTLP